MSETVVEDLGKWQWSLVVTGDDEVVARISVPYDGLLTYSTEDRRNRPDKNSEYQLDVAEVVRRYVAESQTERDQETLLYQVKQVRGDGGHMGTTRPGAADFGRGETLLIFTNDEIDDELLRDLANEVYVSLVEAGIDVDGVAPVLNDDYEVVADA